MTQLSKRVFAEISKTEEQSDGTIKVWGIASTPNTDADGERVTADAMAQALPDYMRFGAVREMHQAKAAGTAVEAEVDAKGYTQFCAHIVDAEAVKKVQAKVYKGFSIGGKVLARDENDPDTITAIKLVEVSLVDRPANPEAILTMFKAEDAAPAAPAEAGDAISQLVDLVKSAEIPADEMVRVLTDAIAKAKAPAEEPAPEVAAEPAPVEAAPVEADSIKAMSLEDLAKGLDEVAKAREAAGLTKGLRGINALSCAIYQLVAVQAEVQREAEDEGDGSAVPGQIADGIKTLLAALVAMAEEETSELAADIDQAGMEAAVPDYSQFAYGAKVMGLAKAARAARDDLNKTEIAGDGTKLSATLLEKFSKLEAENAALQKRLSDLEAAPAPPKGPLLSVTKAQDINKADADVADLPPPGLSPEQLALWNMKKVHSGGGQIIRF